MKRFLCLILSLSLLTGTVCFALAEEAEEEDVEFSDEELAEMEEEEREAEEDEAAVVSGEVYEEPTKEDFDENSPTLYTGVIRRDFGKVIWMEKDPVQRTETHLHRENRDDLPRAQEHGALQGQEG